MSDCDFSLAHYRDLLRAAKNGGYRWAGFDQAPEPGVVQAETDLQAGEVIRPVRLDGDRRGYVIATADTNLEALERAEAAARLVDVEVETP